MCQKGFYAVFCTQKKNVELITLTLIQMDPKVINLWPGQPA